MGKNVYFSLLMVQCYAKTSVNITHLTCNIQRGVAADGLAGAVSGNAGIDALMGLATPAPSHV